MSLRLTLAENWWVDRRWLTNASHSTLFNMWRFVRLVPSGNQSGLELERFLEYESSHTPAEVESFLAELEMGLRLLGGN